MIKEDYVLFEIANILKEKGFDVPTYTFYNPRKSCFIIKRDSCLINRNAGSCVSAPTPQMVMKWLREVYNIFISIDIYSKDFEGNIRYCANIYVDGSRMILDTPIIYDTYEKVDEAAIKYCLTNLI